MGLIKATNAPLTLSPFSMKDIENTAKAVLLRARQQAEELLQAAQVEAEELKKQNRLSGYVEGKQEGMAKGREEGMKAGREQALAEHKGKLTSLTAAMIDAASQLDASRRELESAAKADVVNLAVAISERITKKLGRLDPSIAIANVSEAMKLVLHASDIRIAIHPDQMATLKEAMPHLKQQWPALEHVELREDETLIPGGCRIYTGRGQVDCDLDEQLARIVRELLPAEEAGG